MYAKIAIIIPAFNEAQTISRVVKFAQTFGETLVVDDGSTDDTAMVARSLGATVISMPTNEGYEAAIKEGLKFAFENKYQLAATCDADGQHASNDLKQVLECAQSGYDLVAGQRPTLPRIAEKWFAIVSKWLWNIEDPMCGLKCYRLALFEKKDFQYRSNLIGSRYLIHICSRSKKILNLPVQKIPRIGQSRFGGRISANVKLFGALFLFLIISILTKKRVRWQTE